MAAELQRGGAVVALETSIVAQGLPKPHNLRAAVGSDEAVRKAGAVPAAVAVLEGQLRIGLLPEELEALAAGGAEKVSSRDLGPALARGIAGATTVAATARAADLAGIRFLATGGIGGVHRGHPDDQSADLEELARSRVAVFCAGAKLVLDLGQTLERLESLSVPVIGYGCDEFPAFYLARSGLPLRARADSPEELNAMLGAAWATGSRGVVVAIPPPEELKGAERLVRQAVKEVGEAGGPELTPRLLAWIAQMSRGRSLEVNVRLAVNNASVAGRCAAAWARPQP
ncbi:MAG TPA: pseudouridine-5'-phosphate glycosidase [Candidatus Acidoferrales bacterium]|nr:pseudouridine-5'-phosphate glycosidase [Candidatus Acidoferrales bacterium]